jgi:hypothetical protein
VRWFSRGMYQTCTVCQAAICGIFETFGPVFCTIEDYVLSPMDKETRDVMMYLAGQARRLPVAIIPCRVRFSLPAGDFFVKPSAKIADEQSEVASRSRRPQPSTCLCVTAGAFYAPIRTCRNRAFAASD